MNNDAYNKMDNDAYTRVAHETWGHLYPSKLGIVGEGYLILAQGEYGDIIIIKDSARIESSPWWFSHLNEFMNNFFDDNDIDEIGVYRIDVIVENKEICTHHADEDDPYDEDEFKEILIIKTLGYKKIV